MSARRSIVATEGVGFLLGGLHLLVVKPIQACATQYRLTTPNEVDVVDWETSGEGKTKIQHIL